MFAELSEGALDLLRKHRIADREFTVQMAIDGADFSGSVSLLPRA